MKLSALHEARLARDPKTLIFTQVFNEVKKRAPDTSMDDIAHFCAAMMAEHIHSDYDLLQLHEMAFEGLPTLKDNPQAINNQLQYYYDAETGEDLDSLIDSIIRYIKSGGEHL